MTVPCFCPQCGHELTLRHVDGVDRRVCRSPECHYVHWDNPVPVVAGVIVYNNCLLLARNQLWPAGQFSLITGFVERHEAPEDTVCRELSEELGLTAHSVRFLRHYPFKDKNQLLIAFAVDAQGEPELSNEIAEIRTIPLSDLAHYDFHPFELTRTIVHEWLKSSRPPNSPEPR